MHAYRALPVVAALTPALRPRRIVPRREDRGSPSRVRAHADFAVHLRVGRIALGNEIARDASRTHQVVVPGSLQVAPARLRRIHSVCQGRGIPLDVATDAGLDRRLAVPEQVVGDAQPRRDIPPLHHRPRRKIARGEVVRRDLVLRRIPGVLRVEAQAVVDRQTSDGPLILCKDVALEETRFYGIRIHAVGHGARHSIQQSENVGAHALTVPNRAEPSVPQVPADLDSMRASCVRHRGAEVVVPEREIDIADSPECRRRPEIGVVPELEGRRRRGEFIRAAPPAPPQDLPPDIDQKLATQGCRPAQLHDRLVHNSRVGDGLRRVQGSASLATHEVVVRDDL